MEVEDDSTRRSSILTEAEVVAASDNHQHCLVCYSDLTVRGKIPCDHNDVCGVCHLRLRYLHNDKKCPICKTENERVVVDGDETKVYEDYTMWGDDLGAGYFFQSDVGMFFDEAYYEEEIHPFFGYSCQKCDYSSEKDKNNPKRHSVLRLLTDHLRSQHRLALCQLCVDHKRDFVSRLPRFTPSQLQKHLKQGDGPDSGFSGHPVCEFCKPKRFYDLAFLHQHLHKDHYRCHVCEKQGLDNQFFKNYQSLERHFDNQHFLCRDVQCLSARFVVFENELDLRAHELSVHGGTSTGSTKINLEFRTRRPGYDGSGMEFQEAPSESDFNYGLDGQAFVPQALPNTGGNDTQESDVQLHPLHQQRTEELRAHAAAIRQQQSLSSQEESFPSLQSTAASSSAPLVGWSSGATIQRQRAGKVTAEAFPSLGPAPSAAATARTKAMKGNIGATRRQFAAMTTSAAQPKTAGKASWGTAASTPTPAQTSNFLAPPAVAQAGNRQANLAADNFPALGPSPNARATYTAAHNYTKKHMQQQQPRQATPSLQSANEFPSMAASNPRSKKGNSARDRVMGGQSGKQPSQQAMANMLQAPNPLVSAASGKVTTEEMKASLGPNGFKQLKRLTKDFADGGISPEGYVDQSAALFDKGYGDADFWAFLPSLLESCPNTDAADHALQYMMSVKRQQFSTPAAPKRNSAPAVPSAGWSSKVGNGPARSNVMRAPAASAAAPAARAQMHSLTQPVAARPNQPNVVAAKKKSAWGGPGSATVARAKGGSAGLAAAAQQGPQGGSATKFMSKQKKQAAAANHKQSNKQKKKKEKDELRALAFGK